jgi:hypothetical protein
MNNSPFLVQCDGCGLPASAQHVRERVERLEAVTRFRPIHINVLFLASAPSAKREDDFYVDPFRSEHSRGLLEALHIPGREEKLEAGTGSLSAATAALLEFQRNGYYLAYLSECPSDVGPVPSVSGTDELPGDAIDRLTSSLVTRIRFNYKPKHIVLLGRNLHPFIEVLRLANLGPLLVLEGGVPFELPKPGNAANLVGIRDVLAREIPSLKSVSTV